VTIEISKNNPDFDGVRLLNPPSRNVAQVPD